VSVKIAAAISTFPTSLNCPIEFIERFGFIKTAFGKA
jgi:hypothetical protein